ncbi:hypothetical protein J7T55_006783 [Diaporthe amygdali]|uniref:uncharacterized protein n=1 Tax=Phomopsis amygdali TaxID=1214568 RepID=UPI0022FE1409|nr:uncharacterized protein J7T55_006783 [Diaporthe amygdali]KAJ0125437.1 hypothetical protein J7T55_006783 [Diaporthe amygdali]
MPSDGSRKSVRFGEDTSRSGSSRSSTLRSDSGAGSSSTGSSYSGTAYPDRYTDSLYEKQALQQALQDAVKQIDVWKAKVQEAERQSMKKLMEKDAHLQALDNRCANLEDEKKELQRDKKKLRDANKVLEEDNEDLRKNNEKLQKKLRDSEAQPATAASPKSSKPHRSESKRSKESDVDQQKGRLKERFERSSETGSSDASSTKRSSSKAPKSSRRMSSASYAERPYIEPYGAAVPRPKIVIPTPTQSTTSGGRRFDGPVAISKTGQPAVAQYQDPAYSSTPRSTGMERPTVFYSYDGVTSPSHVSYENGNYYPHPLPSPRR